MNATIRDVGPRDGLQNEEKVLSPEIRAELVNRLAAAGLPRIEAASFVDPRRVVQMAGAEEVVARIDRRPGIVYAGLVLNERGYSRLAGTDLDEIHFTLGATESFNRRNASSSIEESLVAFARVGEQNAGERRLSVSISVSFGCPFEGEVDPGRVVELGRRLVAVGAEEVVLADTIGVAVPRQVRELLEAASDLGRPVGAHFHNTRSTGFANALAALEAGATVLDASVGGIGGCPFAPRATGNIATEDLVYLLEGEGVQTGIDLDALIGVAEWLEGVLARPLPGQVYRAGAFEPVGG